MNVVPRTPLVAIMQGRLSPPIGGQIQAFPASTWAAEFSLAAEAGLDAIEWIFASDGDPLLSPPGRQQVNDLMTASGVRLLSMCADYFMDAPLLGASGATLSNHLNVLKSLLTISRELDIRHIVLPFVDQSAIRGRHDAKALRDVLGSVSEDAVANKVELHLETSLGPEEFASLLEGLPSIIRANYDSGNSAALGYDVREEFAAYGHRVGSVHIKDRLRGAASVPLGTGNADFPALFDSLARVAYSGLFTLQVARGPVGDEVSLARQNRAFVLRHIGEILSPQ